MYYLGAQICQANMGLSDTTRRFTEADFEKLYRRLYPRLFNFSLQFTGDETISQDIVHEVYLKVWKKRDTIEPATVDALLFKMTRNMCLNYIKHLRVVENRHVELRKTQTWEELYRIGFLKDEPVLLIEKELKQKINSIIEALPVKCREVFLLSRMKGLKNREIANQLNISLKAVEKHISRAIRSFNDELPFLASMQLLALILASSS
ncbi:MAG: RNA polymerase sigma-70 factor [Bacteroidota bacterium]